MTETFSFTRGGMALILGAALALSACSEREVILPGEREDIPELALREAETDPELNESRPIRLPAQRSNASWPQAHGSPAFRTDHPALGSAPRLAWSADIGEGDGRRQRITAAPVVADGRVFTLDSAARVTALDTGGRLLWSADLVPPTDDAGEATGGGLAVADGVLYVSLGYGDLVALDAETGAQRWRQQLDATGSGTPLVSGGLVYLVAGDTTGWAVEAATGRVKWRIEGPPSVANVLGAPAPALAGKYVIFAFGSGDLVAAFRQGGLRRWGASVTGQRVGRAVSRISDVTGAPVVVGSRVYAGNNSGRIAAIDTDSGERVWTARQGTAAPVWVVGGSVFAITDINQLVRLDAGDGSTIWAVDLPGYVKDRPRRRGEIHAHYGPVVAGGRVVVASNDGFLRFFDPEDGSLAATVEVPGGATTAPVVAGGTLYVVSRQGELHAFR